MKRLAMPSLLLALTALAGCKSPCVQLAAQICQCQPTQSDRDSCTSAASQRSDQVQPTDADEAACDALIDKCNCHELETAEGKKSCGLAR